MTKESDTQKSILERLQYNRSTGKSISRFMFLAHVVLNVIIVWLFVREGTNFVGAITLSIALYAARYVGGLSSLSKIMGLTGIHPADIVRFSSRENAMPALVEVVVGKNRLLRYTTKSTNRFYILSEGME